MTRAASKLDDILNKAYPHMIGSDSTRMAKAAITALILEIIGEDWEPEHCKTCKVVQELIVEQRKRLEEL